MKSTERNKILAYLNTQKTFVFEGTIEDYIRTNYNYKASNVARMCRSLREDGLIHKIPQPHPDTGRDVNSYVITEAGRKYLLDQMTPENRDFMETWVNKPLQTAETGTLF